MHIFLNNHEPHPQIYRLTKSKTITNRIEINDSLGE